MTATKEEVTKLVEGQASNEANNRQATTKEVYRSQLKTTLLQFQGKI